MSLPKPMLKTVAVRNFLLQLINRAGFEPERLPGEIELCEKFEVSRITVRRALEELENSNYIIRIPGKKGAFTNPETSRAIPYIIGILNFNGKRTSLTSEFVKIMTAGTTALADINYELDFPILNADAIKDIPAEIKNYGYDALIWLAPPAEIIPALNSLIQEEFPIIILDSIFKESVTPEFNTIGYDYAYIGFLRALELKKYKSRNCAYIGELNTTYHSFVKEIQNDHISLKKENLIPTIEEISQKLPKILSATEKVDAIVCDGGIQRYHKVIHVLKSNLHYQKNITLFITNRIQEQQLKKLYPELRIQLFSDTIKTEKLGQTLGIQLKKILQEKTKRFHNIKLTDSKQKGL